MGNKHPVRDSATTREKQEDDFYDECYRVTMAGDFGTGKRSLVWRMVNLEWTGDPGYYSASFKSRVLTIDDVRVKINFSNTLGQERNRALSSSYYLGAHGVFLVYDTTSRATFDRVGYWIEEVRKANEKNEETSVIMLIGNRCDLAHQKEVGFGVAKSFSEDNGLLLFEVSAKDGTNADLALGAMLAQIQHCQRSTV